MWLQVTAYIGHRVDHRLMVPRYAIFVAVEGWLGSARLRHLPLSCIQLRPNPLRLSLTRETTKQAISSLEINAHPLLSTINILVDRFPIASQESRVFDTIQGCVSARATDAVSRPVERKQG